MKFFAKLITILFLLFALSTTNIRAAEQCFSTQEGCSSSATGLGNCEPKEGQWCAEQEPNYQPIGPSSGSINFSQLNKQIGQKFTTVGGIVNAIVPVLLIIAGFFLLYQLVSGGFTLMFSKGDQRAVEGARAKITNAVIGFVILFIAYWLVQILGGVLNIPVFKKLFPEI